MPKSTEHVHPNMRNISRRLYRYRLTDSFLENELSPDQKAILGRSKHVFSYTTPLEWAGGLNCSYGHYNGQAIVVHRQDIAFQ